MTEHSARTAAPRDVPPPRPVAPTPEPAGEGGLGRAARAVVEAVAGLVGGADPGSAAGGTTGPAAAADPGPADGAVLDDLLAAVVPRLPIRDAARLRAAHPGSSDAEIAAALVARAARTTSRIGAAAGGLAAAHRGPAALLALPLELGVESALTAAVEIVLIGELHELHGRPAPGDARARGLAYLGTWSRLRAAASSTGLGSVLGAAGLRSLARRVGRRPGGTVPTSAPLLLGAALAGRGNRKATETLAERVLRDLRGDA
ncbi:hypothetical protein DQ239_16730 [Blastococcus sp. TF02-09]|uniref:hypothetical protein n=1 Tax=Blastococcus sp. TF02-09 TaxID=2250576 RepID=UPI000DE8D3A9|nr:hypothetical protein [Blastococcus sp. TF02-9]RBY75330.1 hypothetical protein DQ239_16730 [Blastococcus sp. TF02-9]